MARIVDTTIKLEIFEGPLDLLLHLIRKNEVDIQDIPVAMITKQYLEYLDFMLELNISLAGEFMVMASTLIQIKTRMMLPLKPVDENGEEEDPRSELSQQLREHAARLKNAAKLLEERPRLDHDVFTRSQGSSEINALKPSEEIVRIGVFELVSAFQKLLNRRRFEQQTLNFHPIKRVSLEDKMSWLLERLRTMLSLGFEECFENDYGKDNLVVTFLALLELARQGMLSLYQERNKVANGQAEDNATWSAIRIKFVESPVNHLEERPADAPDMHNDRT